MDILDLIEKGEVKRFFRARNKFSFSGAVCHVTQRASGSEPLFIEESDYLNMLRLIKEAAQKFSLVVFSFVLMPNHLHLLIKSNEANLSKAMKGLFESYAKFFNSKYKRKGHVFCGPYRCALCFDDSYLLASSIYIHLNPVKAGLVNDPLAYRWSSCKLFLESIEKDTFVDYKFILQILDKDLERAREQYATLLKEAISKVVGNILEDPKAIEGFRENLIKICQNLWKENMRDKTEQKKWLFSDIDLEKKIEEMSVKKRLRIPQELEARKFLITQLKARGFSMAEIAEKLKLSRDGVYKALIIQNQSC